MGVQNKKPIGKKMSTDIEAFEERTLELKTDQIPAWFKRAVLNKTA